MEVGRSRELSAPSRESATTNDLAEQTSIDVDKMRLDSIKETCSFTALFHASNSMRIIDQAHQEHSGNASIVVLDPSPVSLLVLAGVLHTQGYRCVCARTGSAAIEALQMGTQDLLVCDVAEDAAAALETLNEMRSIDGYRELPAVLIAESRWAGLEKQAESMQSATRCLFKPIDPNSLIAVVDQVLWMPSLITAHRKKGTSPKRSGWVTL